MNSFKSHLLYEDAVADAKKKLKPMKGKEVSFTHQASGKKVTGTYQGMKSMGGRSYAHIETGKGAHRVPPHHVHQTQESVANELDEVSADKLRRYVDKNNQQANKPMKITSNPNDMKKQARKMDKRLRGKGMAVDKMLKMYGRSSTSARVSATEDK